MEWGNQEPGDDNWAPWAIGLFFTVLVIGSILESCGVTG